MDKIKHGIERIEINDATLNGVVIEPTSSISFSEIMNRQIYRRKSHTIKRADMASRCTSRRI